ncbi:MAG TPA: hypothetical protein VNG29_00770 [Candidatus Paceibacterota bacterium]|nr:hypothetical protein [Candidatus Paceibacterota bacterium]
MDIHPIRLSSKTFTTWFHWLKDELRPAYAHTLLSINRDQLIHVDRLVMLGSIIRKEIGLVFDRDEFAAAAWLHAVRESPPLREEILDLGRAWTYEGQSELAEIGHDEEDLRAFVETRGTEFYCRNLLEWSPFNEDARDRIIHAILHYADQALDTDDPTLTQALVVAHKACELHRV